MPRSKLAGVIPLLCLLAATPVQAADAVVGPPCNEAAYFSALFAVVTSGGGTVTFICGSGAVIPNTFTKSISGNVTLDGGGQVTLSGGNAVPLFEVVAAGQLTLQGMTLADGYSANYDGGAVSNHGTLIVANTTFRNNRTAPSAWGGAIVSHGRLDITDSLFEGNQAGNGGALYLRFPAQAFIRNTVFRNNATLATDPSGAGGAILAWDGATATIEGGEMYANTANYGGAIYNGADAAQSSVAITGTSIHHNHTFQGGGIFSRGRLTMTATVVDSNSAGDAGGGLFLAGTPEGIPVLEGTTDISGGMISRNSAFQGGGVFLRLAQTARLTGTNIVGNTASNCGGGFDNFFARLTLEGGSVQGNSAGCGAGVLGRGYLTELRAVTVSGNAAVGAGGGLNIESGILLVDHSTVSDNAAGFGAGAFAYWGSLYATTTTFNGNRASIDGGGLMAADPISRLSLRNSTLSGNTAVGQGGGAWVASPLLLENATLTGNAASQGGGVVVAEGGQATLKNAIIANSPQGGNCFGTIASSKYSIASDNTCGLVGPGDRNGTDPKLTPLGAYGGPTLVHMLATGSPAIDGVLGNDAPVTDQRGIARPQGLGYDIGAVERTATDTNDPIDLIFEDGFEPDDLLPS
jgi:hypothetical protein